MRIEKEIKRKIFRVLSCVIYTIIRNYVCIDYLGSDIFKVIYVLVLVGVTNTSTKNMTNYWDF